MKFSNPCTWTFTCFLNKWYSSIHVPPPFTFILLGNMAWRHSIHGSVYSHSFVLLKSTLLCTCTTLTQPVPYWWILEFFLTFAITTNAAKNILVNTSFCTSASVSLGEISRRVTAGSRVNSLATDKLWPTGTLSPPAICKKVFRAQWF